MVNKREAECIVLVQRLFPCGSIGVLACVLWDELGGGADSNQSLMPFHTVEAWKKKACPVSQSVCKNTPQNESICLCSGATLASKPRSGSSLSHHHPHQQPPLFPAPPLPHPASSSPNPMGGFLVSALCAFVYIYVCMRMYFCTFGVRACWYVWECMCVCVIACKCVCTVLCVLPDTAQPLMFYLIGKNCSTWNWLIPDCWLISELIDLCSPTPTPHSASPFSAPFFLHMHLNFSLTCVVHFLK